MANRNRNRRQSQQQQQVTRRDGTDPAHRSARGAQARGGGQELTAFETYQGPLPHPEHLAHLEQIVPGSADLVIKEFVAQGEHRRSLERLVIDGSEIRGGKGQILGFVLLLVAMVCGLVIALVVNAAVGGSVIGGAVAGGALVYVIGGRPPRGQD